MPEAEQQPVEQYKEPTPPEDNKEPEQKTEPVTQPEPERTEAEMQQASHYTKHDATEDDYSEDTATSQDYKEPAAPGTTEPAAPGTEDMEAEDEQQGEFQVMDSIGGDSEAPEADQGWLLV